MINTVTPVVGLSLWHCTSQTLMYMQTNGSSLEHLYKKTDFTSATHVCDKPVKSQSCSILPVDQEKSFKINTRLRYTRVRWGERLDAVCRCVHNAWITSTASEGAYPDKSIPKYHRAVSLQFYWADREETALSNKISLASSNWKRKKRQIIREIKSSMVLCL